MEQNPRNKMKISKLDQELLNSARGASVQAYAKYSKIRVGAAIRTLKGNVFAGCNVENASLGLTQCAERNAIAAAVLAEGPGVRLAAVACVSSLAGPFSPCGACRQVIAEFSDAKTVIFFAGADGELVRETMIALLPQAFGLG
jgi:cytidine deaminase